jgi:large subunit ribosomal protein L17
MRHHIKGYQLNRSSHHRRALFKNLISALVEYGTLKTTVPKAKAVQGQVDKLITLAKQQTLNSERQIDKVLNQRHLVHRLVAEITPATGNRRSGFTRLVKLNFRPGDAAALARLEFVDKMPFMAVLKPDTKAPSHQDARKSAKTAPPKQGTVLPKTSTAPVADSAAPVIKPQAAVKAGLFRQKSGER